jgi:hypothetical protein
MKIRKRYLAVVKPTDQKAPKDPEAWVNNWEATLALAQEKGVGGTQEPTNWFPDLTNATNSWLPGWTRSIIQNKESSIFDGSFSFQDVASDLRTEIQRNLPKSKPKITRGAFPMFAGQQAEDLEEIVDKVDHPKETRKSQHKRKHSAGQQSGYRACGKPHNLDNCFYAFPHLKPKKFRINKSVQDSVTKKIQEDEQLKEEIQKLKGKKQRAKQVPEPAEDDQD